VVLLEAVEVLELPGLQVVRVLNCDHVLLPSKRLGLIQEVSVILGLEVELVHGLVAVHVPGCR